MAHTDDDPANHRDEHLVEINVPHTPLMPLLTPVTQNQLWRALVLRAEVPTTFMPTLTRFQIDARQVDDSGRHILERTLDFGSFVVHDRAYLTPNREVLFDTAAGPTWPRSRLTLRIEAPLPGALFLRFIYESADTDLDAISKTLRQRAWHAADLDMVVRIRELVEENLLND